MTDRVQHGDWEVVRPLGEGGQGTVYVARRTGKSGASIEGVPLRGLTAAVANAVRGIQSSIAPQGSKDPSKSAAECEGAVDGLLKAIVEALDPSRHGALKTRKDRDAASPERFRREIEFMRSNPHPNLLALLDAAADSSWYVSELHPAGSLERAWKGNTPCRGSLDDAWRRLRPLAQAVALLHKKKVVHRDIKAKNVFLAQDGRLVLADPGLVLGPADDRVTGTRQNAASWQWSPLWVRKGRVPEPDPTHDVFSLVKLLWGLIAGRLDDENPEEFMQDHHWDHKEYDLRVLFSGDGPPRFRLLSERIFARVLVDRTEKCLIRDAEQLISEIDQVVRATRRSICMFCERAVLEPVAAETASRDLKVVSGIRFDRVHGDDPVLRADVSRCPECRSLFFRQYIPGAPSEPS